jgi:hypothetical protein
MTPLWALGVASVCGTLYRMVRFSFTHLRPQDFMQNLLSYGGKKVADGVLHHYVSGARLSWVDVDNVAEWLLLL